MRIGVSRERRPRERRVAMVPATAKVYREWGWEPVVEPGAGDEAGFTDGSFREAGAAIADPTPAAVQLVVGPPDADLIASLPPGTVLVGHLDPYVRRDLVGAMRDGGITGIAVEAIPRITLAQSMDALSSQATVAGYAAVLLGVSLSAKLMPMMVTAAGTIPPARVLVLGAGVAGLQAIATARRLGAVVHAYDIREDTREQVESLGARFIAAPTESSAAGGYAREVTADVQRSQMQALAPHVAEADVLITTAQIPGRPAPRLVGKDMVSAMKRGAIVIDVAAATGGNVEGTVPDETVRIGGALVVGPTDLASHVASDASRMYSRNLRELMGRMRRDDGIAIDLDDEIIGPATITHEGRVIDERAGGTS